MSILKVDTINEKTTGNGVSIPGHVIQYAQTETGTATTISASSAVILLTINFTPKLTNSLIRISYCFQNLRKTTGAGTSTWFQPQVYLDSTLQGNMNGTMGYPETFADHRYTFSGEGQVSAWSGAKDIKLRGYVGSSGSTWVVSYQGATTNMTIMEIAQ
tara:strand:+ start:127 stop:603 length:477 start_codon:yes stop_codon:yes gene_type:complete